MFLHFYNFEHLIRRNPPQFSMVWSGLEKYHPRKKVTHSLMPFTPNRHVGQQRVRERKSTFDQFKKNRLTSVFK